MFGFGRHRGDPVDAHPDFLDWMLGRDFPPSTLAVARAELQRVIEASAEPENPSSEEIDDIPF